MASLSCLAANSGLSGIGARKFTFETQSRSGSKRESRERRGKGSVSVRNEAGTNVNVDDKHTSLRSGNDQLEITRVINGMWQTSGGWGRIERDAAVDAMMRHVDAGFTTFDMADHCKLPFASIPNILKFSENSEQCFSLSPKLLDLNAGVSMVV